jgi:NTP pyrophosphatase (non-canonical NTP hydrolase)
MTKAMPKSLREMEAEVEAYCRDKGWYEQEVPFAVAMALLHEEAAEAGHAWRDHGLADATYADHPEINPGGVAVDIIVKPEGVGSEFADILIRLLDDSARYRLGLPGMVTRTARDFAVATGEFLVDVNTMHGLVARASVDWPDAPSLSAVNLAGLLVFLELLCERYGIDLEDEYERKMQFNRTRPYRHGGRRA